MPDFGVTGTAVDSKKPEEQEEDFFDNRVMRGLPDYSNNPELRELALTLQRYRKYCGY